MLVQNYGWPTGPAKIWLWLADGRLGGLGPAGSTTPDICTKNKPYYIPTTLHTPPYITYNNMNIMHHLPKLKALYN